MCHWSRSGVADRSAVIIPDQRSLILIRDLWYRSQHRKDWYILCWRGATFLLSTGSKRSVLQLSNLHDHIISLKSDRFQKHARCRCPTAFTDRDSLAGRLTQDALCNHLFNLFIIIYATLGKVCPEKMQHFTVFVNTYKMHCSDKKVLPLWGQQFRNIVIALNNLMNNQ